MANNLNYEPPETGSTILSELNRTTAML